MVPQVSAPDGAFFELNPRLSGSHVIADHAGLDLASVPPTSTL